MNALCSPAPTTKKLPCGVQLPRPPSDSARMRNVQFPGASGSLTNPARCRFCLYETQWSSELCWLTHHTIIPPHASSSSFSQIIIRYHLISKHNSCWNHEHTILSLLPLLIHHSAYPLLPLSLSVLHSRLKTYLFHKSYSRSHFFLPYCLHVPSPGPFLLSYSAFLGFPYIFVSVSCARLSWPTVSYRILSKTSL